MSTSSPTIAAMRMGVSALERKRDFDEAVMNLRRAGAGGGRGDAHLLG